MPTLASQLVSLRVSCLGSHSVGDIAFPSSALHDVPEPRVWLRQLEMAAIQVFHGGVRPPHLCESKRESKRVSKQMREREKRETDRQRDLACKCLCRGHGGQRTTYRSQFSFLCGSQVVRHRSEDLRLLSHLAGPETKILKDKINTKIGTNIFLLVQVFVLKPKQH